MARKRNNVYTLAPYTADSLDAIDKRVARLRERYPEVPEYELRVREVISRFKGEAGLTEAKVLYLTGCIMRAIHDTNEEYVRKMGPTFVD